MSLKLITPPGPVISLEDAKKHIRVDSSIDDALIEGLVAAATQHLDGWFGILGRALGVQTWELYLDSFPCGAINIPLRPIIAVTSVIYDDENGDAQTIDAANYEVDDTSSDGWVVPLSSYSWPSTISAINAVRVRFTAGYETLPKPLVQAICLLAGGYYENRESVSAVDLKQLPFGVETLISPYRQMYV